jgi:conjugative relaxase-like TrwC/TraI family protein
MALRPTVIRNAGTVVGYFGQELNNGVSEYYAKAKGVWHGKLRNRVQLSSEVTKEEFVALMNNRQPNGERLTPRTNKTRKKKVWELDEASQSRVQVEREVSNRKVAVDWTLSVTKDISFYLAASHDQFAESLVYKAAIETFDSLEAQMQTEVSRGCADFDRTTGEALFALFVHRTTRPVDGLPDPHWHVHGICPNFTYDEVEQRFKATETGLLFASKARLEAVFHVRCVELLIQAGYGFRRTADGMELTVLASGEKEIFCKRTREIEALEKKESVDLNRKAAAIVAEAGKKGVFLEHDVEYGKLKDKLGARTRKGKDTIAFEGAALEAEWAKQLTPGRWEAITPEAARNHERIDFLDAETAKRLAIQHAFEKEPVIRDVDLFKSIALFGAGTMTIAAMDAFCKEDPRLARNPDAPDMVTTHEIIAEEQAIRDVVTETRGKYAPISEHGNFVPVDTQLDAGQLAAVKLVLTTTDLAVAVPGYTGAGKSRTVKEAARAVRSITGDSVLVLAPTGRAAKALGTAAGADEAHTIAYFRANERLQKEAAGHSIFVDEFSLINNDDGKWLLDFAKENGCRLTFWGDGKQHVGVSRGCPIVDLLDSGLLDYRQLNVIYRQTNAELLAAVQLAADGKFKESFKAVREKWMTTADNETKLRAKIVEAMVEKITMTELVLAIALMHRQGEAIAADVRARLKELGLLSKEDVSVRTLKDVHLTEAQRADPINYAPGQVLKFHRNAKGCKSSQAWEVERVEDGAVFATHDGVTKTMPISDASAFGLYESAMMPLAAGDMIQITKNNARLGVKTGELRKVLSVTDQLVSLDNGKQIDVSEGLHARQGYTVTSHGAQGHDAPACFLFLPASSAGMMNQRQWLVDVSRAKEELRMFTDCPEVVAHQIEQTEARQTALSLLAKQRYSPFPRPVSQEHAALTPDEIHAKIVAEYSASAASRSAGTSRGPTRSVSPGKEVTEKKRSFPAPLPFPPTRLAALGYSLEKS